MIRYARLTTCARAALECVCVLGQAALAKDVKNELEAALDTLAGKGKGTKGKAPRGLERKKMWEEVRALRKEYVRVP